MTCIAVVNDDSAFLDLIKEMLEDEGWQAYTLTESQAAFERLRTDQPDLIILDIRMDMAESGWHILDLLTLDPHTRSIPVIVCSADLRQLQEKDAWLGRLGVTTLPKPFDLDLLYERVHDGLSSISPSPAETHV